MDIFKTSSVLYELTNFFWKVLLILDSVVAEGWVVETATVVVGTGVVVVVISTGRRSSWVMVGNSICKFFKITASLGMINSVASIWVSELGFSISILNTTCFCWELEKIQFFNLYVLKTIELLLYEAYLSLTRLRWWFFLLFWIVLILILFLFKRFEVTWLTSFQEATNELMSFCYSLYERLFNYLICWRHLNKQGWNSLTTDCVSLMNFLLM